MSESQEDAPAIDWARSRAWIAVIAIVWLAAAALLIWDKWNAIHFFQLPDTDDNLRFAQVRAWLHGQGWFDLRQYRLNPPIGADIHWSRVVDLPLAGLMLLLQPFVGTVAANKAAVAFAPLIPLLLALYAVGLAARRLIAPATFLLAAAVLLCAPSALAMFTPLRIDHHGWQLALLMLAVAGLTDPKPGRGGATVGAATALSLAIGLESLLYLAFAGGAIALRWAWSRDEALRVRAYALTLAGGAACGYAAFASYANRAPVCDALSPVWLSAALLGGALLFLLSFVRDERWPVRLAVAAAAGAALAAAFALVWPDCLGRPEHVSPELDRLWLSNIREAKPIYEHSVPTIVTVATLPIIGLVGSLFASWRARRTPLLAPWLSVLGLALLSTLLLLWQARVGSAAQLLAVPGACALGWPLIGWFRRQQRPLVRVLGVVGSFVLVSGLLGVVIAPRLPSGNDSPRMKAVNRAGAKCPTLSALRPIARLPAATIMTFVDLGPRLIAVTHHRAIASPHHRNGEAILDIHHAFGGSPALAHAIAKKHGATLLLICPHFAESTVYRARAPHGFYARLEDGERFDWLEPMTLPKGSPYRLYRIN